MKENRDNLVKEQLTVIHTKTRKTSFVIVEIPQSISQDEFDVLYRTISPTRPVTFLVVKRGKPSTNDLAVTDWGNDIYNLVSVYKPYLSELYSNTILAKKERELDLLIESPDAFKKTPFYVGLLTFEESFYAINDYIKNFVAEVNGKEGQRKVLIYLSLIFDYLGQALPASFLQTFLSSDVDQFGIFRLESYFSKNSSIVESLLNHRVEGKQKYWSIKHAFFAKELKKQLLSNSSLNPENWKEKLSNYCLEFIQDSSYVGENSEYIDELLQKLFIGTRKDRSGEDFTPIIKAMPTIEEKEQVFVSLKETYPANPHYASHLARFYAYNNKNFTKALDYATEAIELGHAQGLQDPLLHHIKGMVLRTTAQEKMDSQVREKRAGKPTNPDVYDEIIYNLIPSAEGEFTKSREIGKADYKTDEHGYVAHIQMLIRAIDYASKVLDIPRHKLISENKQPFGEWFDLAESLLEDVKGLNRENGDNIKINECENGIEEIYENFEVILQNLNNFLQKSPNPSRTRRQIVRTYFRRNPEYYRDSDLLQKILTLLQENLENEPESEKNFFLWFKVARHSSTSVATALSQLKIWKTKSSTVEAIFYLYILHILRAFDGYSESVIEAEKLISECKGKSRGNITIHEWYGKGKELNSIKNRHDVNDENKTEQLEYVEGVFSEFTHKGDGYITILDKLRVFFSPTQAKLTSADLNKPVKFYLGFTYDGLRADSLSVVTTGN